MDMRYHGCLLLQREQSGRRHSHPQAIRCNTDLASLAPDVLIHRYSRLRCLAYHRGRAIYLASASCCMGDLRWVVCRHVPLSGKV